MTRTRHVLDLINALEIDERAPVAMVYNEIGFVFVASGVIKSFCIVRDERRDEGICACWQLSY